MNRKICFDAVVSDSTRLLILGSLPGDESLRQAQYYANKRNAFWSLMSQVLDVDLVAMSYDDRLHNLLERRVGLWDVVADAVRDGSLDSSIKQHRGNELAKLIVKSPQIKAVAFNGQTAAKLGRRLVESISAQIEIYDLPSSSPAHTMSFDKKLESWLILRSCL
jgi:hypoxanthine-DNA glycosylase